MTDEGGIDALNMRAPRGRRRMAKAFGIAGLIIVGIVAGAKLWQPVRTVEQHVATPIREVVQRTSPLERLADAAAGACPAIVSLRLPGLDGPAPQGVVISADGQVVTSAAVPPETDFEAWIDGRKLKARLQAHDPLTGLSLIQLDGVDMPTLSFAEPDIAPPGAWGFTLASPNGSGCVVEQAAVASDFATDGASNDYYLRIHATGDQPADGTPFLSADGRIVALAQPSIGEHGRGDRYLSADLISLVVSRLVRSGMAPPAPFGIVAEDLAPVLAARIGADRGRGAVIVVIARGSPAEASGLHIGDVILSAGRNPISSASELGRVLDATVPIELTVSRGRERTQLTFTLAPAASS